ncbi:UvrD-helicase domain-containing protein [Dactylosporangium aurantiacum]|uniref:UvrD-helicase domain-containing protein n=1 Tax=Dactylosporangium aurantiacum TaxID=35754 RepID=A0A9Q9MBX3_9ACTN|nr:UvrD-helicase domain-containing protein [Dactylosporangium aurantiacum]MDG6102301.1 UvrD-helicase domain-containing protein [Dactylosporangium aurantiacum]UWZ53393.1 UvrD-helicase domain-containing protein [Dactylosporangium aurantiacum]
MESKSAELAAEQQHFDLARKHRERVRAELGEAPDAAANAGTGRRLALFRRNRKEALAAPEEQVAFGRIDCTPADPGVDDVFYIGRETILDDQRQVLVVNWQTPIGALYYEATHEDPRGLERKRTFHCAGNQIRDFDDVVFAQLAGAVAALDAPDDALLAELDRGRTGTMTDIVATIQGAQSRLIRSPLDQVLVIEGGPGTGKTAVALHRVSWLLFNHRDRLRPQDVLVVGPHPAFTRYIRTVLPSLGDADVAQLDIDQLGPPVQRGRPEPPQTRRLKGEARMARLLARALENRVGTPEPAERLLFDGAFITLSGVEVAAAVAAARQAGGPYAQRRQRLRAQLADLVRGRGGPTDPERLGPVENLLERLWPLQSAAAFLRALLGSRARLANAAGDEFTPDELALLHRRGADKLSEQIWSNTDLPLLDELEELLNGPPRRYRHIVVDEAQDLSPMQLRAVARRSSTGSLTVVGDLAQSTGAWAREHWGEVTEHLPTQLPQVVVGLRYGYRVPRQVYELAAELLPVAAPDVEPTRAVREGPADPGIHVVEPAERAGRAALVAKDHALGGRFVGIVCPAACRAELEFALHANDLQWGRADQGELDHAINLISPQEAKGLEFDAVIVVEPEEIVAEDDRGHRLLFVALTRTIRYLDIVCSGDPLPVEPGPDVTARIPRQRVVIEPDADPTVDMAQLDRLAEDLAALVVAGAPVPMWDEVLQRTATLLDERADRSRPSGRHRRA